eukprot:5312057-Pyramimonas_sp.AAC.1
MPIIPIDVGSAERKVRGLSQSTTQKEIGDELGEIRRKRVMFLDLGNWKYNYLYSAELVTEQFDKPILVADGQRDIIAPLRLAGLPEERP